MELREKMRSGRLGTVVSHCADYYDVGIFDKSSARIVVPFEEI
jgi:hypothetical protein